LPLNIVQTLQASLENQPFTQGYTVCCRKRLTLGYDCDALSGLMNAISRFMLIVIQKNSAEYFIDFEHPTLRGFPVCDIKMNIYRLCTTPVDNVLTTMCTTHRLSTCAQSVSAHGGEVNSLFGRCAQVFHITGAEKRRNLLTLHKEYACVENRATTL